MKTAPDASDILTEATEATEAAEAAEAAATTEAEKKQAGPRRASTLDLPNKTVYVTEQDKPDKSFALGTLPDHVQTHMAVFGLWMALRQADDMDAAYAKFVAGELPAPRKVGGAAEINPWRQAIADALVVISARGDNKLTPEQALEHALKLTREQVASAKTDELVIKHYNKLTGATKNSVLQGLLPSAD